jgi:GAF domain-containing protein/HAMP domain-containing protein
MNKRGISSLLNFGIGVRLTLILLAVIVVSIAVLVYFSITTIRTAGQSAQQASNAVLREQSEDYLSQLTDEFAENYDIRIEKVRADARVLADFAVALFSNSEVLNSDAYWLAADHMIYGADGQYMSRDDDISSLYVPNSVEITEEINLIIEQSAFLDFQIASIVEGDPNTVAAYLITKEDITRYYPNIDLGNIVPADYSPVSDIFFQISTPENNPDRAIVWTPVYDDPAAQGFLVSAIAPVYSTQDEFLGVIGIDLSLTELTDSIENLDIATGGYLFLVDDQGRTLALPQQGYLDLLGPDADPNELGVDLLTRSTQFSQVVQDMVAGSSGFQELSVSGEELFVSYAPLSGTGWSLASVTRAEQMLRAGSELQEQLDAVSDTLIRQRILRYAALILVISMVVGFFITNRMVTPLRDLAQAAEQLGAGDLDQVVHVTGRNEIGVLASSLNTMREQLRDLFQNLEERVSRRTQDLELAAEVGRRLSLLSDLETMLTEAGEIIRQRFDLYYVQIYLTDDTNRFLVLRSGTGEVGQSLLMRRHRLPLDRSSLNGTAAVERQPVIVENTAESLIHRPNPLLPETRSEMVMPLLVGDRVVGVLDMQSSQPGALSEENLFAFDVLANQLAIAIANSLLFEQADEAQEALKKQMARTSIESWQEYLDAIENPERIGYAFDQGTLHPLDEPLSQISEVNSILSPIHILGQRIGAFRFENETGWSASDAELVASVSEQLSQQIENLRLIARSERFRREAQEAVQRLTREGWAAVQERTGPGYEYDGQEVTSLSADSDSQPDDAALANMLSYDIRVRDEAIGQFMIAGLDELSAQQQALISGINLQFSTHIERLRLQQQSDQALSETEDQTVRLSALNELSDALNRAETLDEIYQTSAMYLSEIVDSERVSMTRLLEVDDEDMLEVFALQGETGLVPTGSMVPVDGTAVGDAVLTQRDVVVPDLRDSKYGGNSTLIKAGLLSSMAIPLMVGGESIGTINFGSQKLNTYTTRMRDIANQAVSLIASAIEIRNLFEQTQTALDRTDILYAVSQGLNEAESDDDILFAAVRPAVQAGAISANLVHLELDEQGDPTWAEITANWRREGESPVPVGTRFFLPDMPFSGLWISDPEHPVFVSDVRTDERLDEISKTVIEQGGSRAITIVPLGQTGLREGLLIFNWLQPHEYSQIEKEIYTTLIGLVSPKVQSRRINQQTQIRADQEALINRISQQIQSTTTVDDALQVAIRELGRALDAKWTSVQLG